MRIWNSAEEYDLGACAAALGTFDGVHIGHQALLRCARESARQAGIAAVACTFDRHPLELLCPEHAPTKLLSREERLQKMELMGMDGVLVQPFTRAFAMMDAQSYLRTLAEQLKLRVLVVGFNYSFGAQGKGDARMIERFATELGYEALIIDKVLDQGETVSSSLIRALKERGEMARAERLMQITY